MISSDCEKCPYLDESNEEYPCSLEFPLRCNILYKYVNNYRCVIYEKI